jgi:lipopolysaccharide biosynthesis glycosyltransferase
MNTKYNIVCVSDETYCQHTAVMLCSLFEKNKDTSFEIYLLTFEISTESQSKLLLLCTNYNSTIQFIRFDTIKLKQLPVGQWSSIMYLKLFIPQVLPANAERCLFLDVDMVINADISPLYNIDLEDNVLGAAEDIPDCIAYKPRLSLLPDNLYINSGVMVYDLNLWREMEQERPIFDFTHSVTSKIQNEQDVIAMYFKDKIKCLPIRWNMTTFYFRRSPKIFEKYLPQLKEARQQPSIIHFACPIKPWFRDCNHPFGFLYRRYLRLTPWVDAAGRFSIFEQLTPRQRFNKHIRYMLNCFNILKNDDFLIK